MSKMLRWTLGAITFKYYMRQFIIGCFFYAFYWYMFTDLGGSMPTALIVLFTTNLVFFAYSKFSLTSFLEFLNGGPVLHGSFFGRVFYSLLCFCFTVFLAPLGLAYLFYLSYKQDTANKQPQPTGTN